MLGDDKKPESGEKETEEEEQPEEEAEKKGEGKQTAEPGKKETPGQKQKRFDLSAAAKRLPLKALSLLIVGLVIGTIFGLAAFPCPATGNVSLPGAAAGGLDAAALKEKAEAYLEENLLPEGMSLENVSISAYNDFFYKFEFELTDGEQSQAFSNFITADGKLLFLGSGTFPSSYFAYELDEPLPELGEQPESQTPAAEVQQSDKPKVELFVMSYCPYGLQMEKAILPVMKLLGEEADISIKFVSYIMHDWQEIEENTTQYCIQLEQNEKLFDYMNCFVVGGDSDACIASAGIDAERLSSCVSAADQQFAITAAYEDRASWLSGSYPQYNVDAELNEEYGIQGSPTLIINGTEVPASRSPEAVKQVICSAFSVQPEECSQTLSTEIASAGFGSGTGSSSEGYC